MATKRSFSDIPGAREALQLVVEALKPHYEFRNGITVPWTLIFHVSDDLQLEGRLADPEERYHHIPRRLINWPYLIVSAKTGAIDGVSPAEKNPVIYATTDRVVMDMSNTQNRQETIPALPMLPPYQWTLEVRYT